MVLRDVNDEMALCCIEKVHAFPGMSAKSTTTFMKNAGGLETLLEVTNTPHELIPPTRWQNAIIGKSSLKGKDKKKDTKKRALEYVRRRFPEVETKHDGILDSICIAEYSRRLHFGELNKK